MTREETINRLESLIKWGNLHEIDVDACKMAIKALEKEPTIEAYKQVCKERDIAIEQLHELGYEWGQKIEPCDDVISRHAALSMQYRIDDSATLSTRDVVNVDDIEDLPPVKPQYTDDEIKKMQDLEQAEIQKAYKLGKAETGLWIENLCDSCTNKACEFQSGIQRSKCDFYIPPMPHLEPDNCGNYVVQQEQKTDEENIHREREQAYMQGYEDACKKYRQEPKTGHWISLGVQGEVDGQIVRVFSCSKCGAISIFRMASGNIVNGDICPNCGAKMEQESEE